MNKIIFAVVMLFQLNHNKVIGTATGFFYSYNKAIYLITNRHVVNSSLKNTDSKLVFRIHTNKANLKQLKTIEVPLVKDGRPTWFHYANPKIDVVAIKLDTDKLKGGIVESFSNKDFPPKGVEDIQIGTDLLVVGYPRGFTDKATRIPIVKSCIISTPFGLSFNNYPFFLMDGNLFPGMSGSPVITTPKSTRVINGKLMFSDDAPVYFMGIHSSTYYGLSGFKEEPVYEYVNGEIKIKALKRVPIRQNLDIQTCWYNGVIENLIEKLGQ